MLAVDIGAADLFMVNILLVVMMMMMILMIEDSDNDR